MSMWCFNQQLIYKICYSLLFLCTVIRSKMYKPRLLLQFGIHRWSYSRVEERVILSDILRVVEDSVAHVMGAKKNRVLERVSVTCPVLFAYYFQVRMSCMQLWLQFVTKENAMFCCYYRWFSKYKPSLILEAKQATTVFARKIKEKHMKEMRRILLWKTDKLLLT